MRKTFRKERIRDQSCIVKCEFSRSETFGVFPRLASGNSLQETFRTSNPCPRHFDLTR